MRDKRGDEARLRHIRDTRTENQSYIETPDLEEFAANPMQKYATVKQLEMIGEAANTFNSDKREIS